MDQIFEKITKILTLSLFIGTIIMLGMYCKRKFDTLELTIRQQSSVIQNIISLLSENETNIQGKQRVNDNFSNVYSKVVVSDSEAESDSDVEEEEEEEDHSNEIVNVTEMPSLEPIQSVSLDSEEKIESSNDEVNDEITDEAKGENEIVKESERKEDELKINKMDLGENQYKHLKVPEIKKIIEEKGLHEEMKTNMSKKEMIQLLLKHEIYPIQET